MRTEEMKLDGNAIGGLLAELFGTEMTATPSVCKGCGAEELLARVDVYVQAAGTVVRCRHCESVLMRVVRAPGRMWVDLSGFRTIELRVE